MVVINNLIRKKNTNLLHISQSSNVNSFLGGLVYEGDKKPCF